MSDVTKIRPNLWIGNFRPAGNHDWLVAQGVTAILNVARDFNDMVDLGVPRYKQGLVDGPGNTTAEIDNALFELNELLDSGKAVLVHCCTGWSRSPYVAARVLAGRESRNFDDVYAELLGLRPEIRNPSTLKMTYGS